MAIDPATNPFLIGANPENFGGNRRDDFGAVFTGTLMMPWRFPGAKPREDRKTGKKSTFAPYNLFARVSLLADDDSPYGATESNEMYQAGYLASTAPTEDHETPKGASWETYAKLDAGEADIENEDELEELGSVYILGKRKGFKLPASDYAQLLISIDRLIRDATEAEVKAQGWNGWAPNHDCTNGLHCHFNLLDRDDKMGNRRPIENKDPNVVQKDFKILCATALLDPVERSTNPVSVSLSSSTTKTAGKSSGKSGVASKANGSESNATAVSDDFDTNLEGFVVTQIVTLPAAGKKAIHSSIMAEVPANFPGDIQKAITKLNSPWVTAAERPWVRKGTGYELKES